MVKDAVPLVWLALLTSGAHSTLSCYFQGNKVKLVMKFEGRQLQHKDQGKEVLLVSVVLASSTGRGGGSMTGDCGTRDLSPN